MRFSWLRATRWSDGSGICEILFTAPAFAICAGRSAGMLAERAERPGHHDGIGAAATALGAAELQIL